MTESILIERSGGTATITLNRPEKLNAMSDDMVDLMIERLKDCAADTDVSVVIVTGAGRGFCAGGDVNRMGGESANNTPVVAKNRLWDRIQHIPMLMEEFDKPVIAAVNGVAAGLGLDMALMCDIRIAAKSARFCASYARIGLVPGGGGGWLLPKIIGQSKALEILWTADIFDSARALELGLVSSVVADADVLATARALAERLVGTSPLAVQMVKRTLWQAMQTDLESHLDQVSSHMAVVRTTEDHVEAVTAHREKRRAQFKNR